MNGVEGAGDRQRDDSSTGRGIVLEGLQLLEGAGRDDLAGSVVVRGGEPGSLDRGQHLVRLAGDDRGHPGGLHR
ncbi:hypothetical protein SDC9_156543 [bioreactor metagenome]|uniref:Uncharacterized protein n=1 Tax=bioreactor metagenome TaxID=1076179 RepID=A0A645F9K1_9ZZZZ